MEELVQAIDNISKISIKDIIFLLINIISSLSTIIIAIVVYSQNKRFNKENEILQKKLNEIENKRILYTSISDIYNKFLEIFEVVNQIEDKEKLLDILMNINIKEAFVERLALIKYSNIDNWHNYKIIFKGSNEILVCLENIVKKYNEFYNKLIEYINISYFNDYEMTLREIQNSTNIKLIRVNEYEDNTDLTLNDDVIFEHSMVYDDKFREIFYNKIKSFRLDEVRELAIEISSYFTEEKFYSHFEEYLSIDKMDI